MLNSIYNKLDKRGIVAASLFLIFIIALEIFLTCIIPHWKEYFFNVLSSKDTGSFSVALTYFFLLMMSLGAVQGFKAWVSQKVSLKMREAGNKVLLKTWVKSSNKHKNYTQPITQALKYWTELSVYCFTEVFISASIIVGLVAVNLHNSTIIYGALFYTVLITVVATVFNKPLVTSDSSYQACEGVYRESLSDIDNGNGDFTSKSKFLAVVQSYTLYIKNVMYFTMFSKLKMSTASIIPFLMLSPSYFEGSITMGDLMAGVATFELLVANSTILLQIYPSYTKFLASYNISNSFYNEVVGK